MKKVLLALAALTLSSAAVYAHHGHSSQWDVDRIVEISGSITDLAFVNPHAYVYLDVTSEDGTVINWHCEMRAGSVMRRSGWTKEMFENGTKIDIVGIMSRTEDDACYIETIAFNGGEPIERYAQIDANKLKPADSRPTSTAWGDPNIAGDWAAEQRLHGAVSGAGVEAGGGMAMAGMGGMGGMGMGRGSNIELTEAGTQAAAEIAANAPVTAGRLDCNPRDFFSDWTFDQHSNKIIQEEDKITLKYGFMDTERVIHMNWSEHPADLTPSWAGHSVGKWYNGELYVDTYGFTVDSARSGIHSNKFHVTERFTLENDGKTLRRRYMAQDPLFWQTGQVHSGEDVVNLSDYPHEMYNCDDRTVE